MNVSSNINNNSNNNSRGSSGGVDGTQPPEPSIATASALTHASAASAAYDGASFAHSISTDAATSGDRGRVTALSANRYHAAMLHGAGIAGEEDSGTEAGGNVPLLENDNEEMKFELVDDVNGPPMTDAQIISQIEVRDKAAAAAAAAAATSGNGNARANDDYAPVPPAQIDAQTAVATTTTTNMEDPPTDEYVPVPPALVAEQTAAAYDEMDAAIKETVAESLRTDPPILPAQTAAAYDDMENVLKTSVEDNENDDAPLPRYYDPDDFNYLTSPAAQNQKPRAKTGIDNSQGVDAPIPPSQIGDQYNAMGNTIKSMKDNEFDDDALLHPSIAAAGLDDDEENQNQKPRTRRGANENDDAARMAPATPTSGNRGEATALPANHHERPSSAPPELEVAILPPQSTPPPAGNEENTLPPPTLEATSPTNNNEENLPPNYEENPPVPVLEATLVEESPPVPNVDDEPRVVYMATQVNSSYKKYSLAVLISLLIGGMATAIAMLAVGNSSNSGDEVNTQPIEQTSIGTTSPQDTQPIEKSPLTTTPPTSMLNSTILSPVLPPSNPPTNETTAAPTTAITLALAIRPTNIPVTPPPTLPPTNKPTMDEPTSKPTAAPVTAITLAPLIRPTSMPVPATLTPAPRPALSAMEQLQSSALELVPSEAIVSHVARENVAMYGDTLIVGAPSNNNWRGFALVYIRDDKGEWSQQAKLEAPDGADYDYFGRSVAIHGNAVIVGAYQDDDNGSISGSADVFVRNRGTWMHQAKLLAPDGAAGDWFGYSVGIFDDTVIIGAPADDSFRGSAHLFVQKNGNWTHQAKLTAPDGRAGAEFGRSVGIFDDTVIVGAPFSGENGSNSGSIHLFALNQGIWTHQTRLLAPDGAANDLFGWSVGIFGDNVVVGARYDDDNGFDSGSAQVFALDNNIWTHQAKIVAPDGAADDRFGSSVGIYMDTVVVGSYLDDDNGIDSGSLHLFTRNEGAWDYHAKLLAPKTGVEFGQSVVAYNGTVVTGSGGGEVYVFSIDSE